MLSSTLEKPVQYLKGVGPQRARRLQRLEVSTVGELLYHFPRDWQDRQPTLDFSLPTANGLVVARGRVTRALSLRAGPRLGLLKATINTGSGSIEAVWFKHLSRRYDVFATQQKEIVPGADLWIVGRAEASLAGIKEVHVEEYYKLEYPRWALHVGRLTPVYALTEGLNQRLMRELVDSALAHAGEIPELLPRAVLERRKLLAAPQAIKGIHFPGSQAELEAARGRLAYEELFLLELAWTLKRRQTRGFHKGFSYDIKRRLLTPFKAAMGFEFTSAQKRVINEIFSDMQKPYPMTRLLQGDVGSGKTVVALSAMLLAAENGYQSAFMVPTEILADQHLATMRRLLRGLPVRVERLTSAVPKKEREKILSAVRSGEVDMLIGTHALLESDVRWPRLKLAVIDEQHRFGVRQRATLRQTPSVDLLVMTATPIPRTLALALYGDLDISTLDELPPGRRPAQTLHVPEEEALLELKREVAAGRQGFIVYPIIEESSRLDLQAAKAEYERLRQGPLAGLRTTLIHGAMPGGQKNKIMSEFSQGLWDVLVATPVIEVGIDVPNATVMAIQNADRFGLSSLHQLRGRVGRGSEPSRCFLIADPKTPEARRRLDILVSSHDGFRIGEEDLKLRGPGELLGTAQHGELSLKVADLIKDRELLACAREDAERALSTDPTLSSPENRRLRQRLIDLYQQRWHWIDLA
ncbi:MAG: ATP-dependent DNA helicase RecG [Elusimicrobia bacterium]|nr:ATP-dependent DNA helicase RecG [Elusimicrobiota bacterium]